LKYTLTIFISLIIMIWTAACEGPAGPAGSDAVLADSLPPVIEWIQPASGEVIDSAVTLIVRASDDQELKQVVFYIAGLEYSDSLEIDNDLYIYRWNTLHWDEGPYPLMARAWDRERNTSRTPDIIIEIVHP